jgi:uncharacterized protein (TIGR02996 family)
MARKRRVTAEDAFLQAISETPGDDAPRLVYADGLEDNNQPQRAEFIRLQCRLAAMDEDVLERFPLKDREEEMLAVYRGAWLGSLPAWVHKEPHEFRRGFVDWLSLTATQFIRKGEALRSSAPLHGMRLRAVAHYTPDVAACSHLSKLAALDLRDNDLVAQDVRALVASPYLDSLTELGLSQNRIGLDGVKALASWRQFPHLIVLDLSDGDRHANANLPDPAAVKALLASHWQGRLARLDLSGNFRVGDEGARTLAASFHLHHLIHLNLNGCQVGAAGIRALGTSAHLADLRTLDLSESHLNAEDLQALAAAPLLGRLTSLALNRAIGPKQAAALAESPHLGHLRRLELRRNELGTIGAEALAKAHLASLVTLLLYDNTIDAAGVQALAASPHLAGMACLELSDNDVGDAGARALATSPHLGNLRDLNLSACNIGPEGAAALAASPHLAGLTTLDLGSNDLGDEGARSLAASPHLANLRSLGLYHSRLTDKAALALARSPHLGQLRILFLGANDGLTEKGRDAVAKSPCLPRLVTLSRFYGLSDQQALHRFGKGLAL